MIKETIIATLLLLASSSALAIDACYSGLWFDPTRNGEGISVDVVSEDQVVVLFYTYNNDLDKYWYIFQGETDALVAYDTLKTAEEPFNVVTAAIGSGELEVVDTNTLNFYYDFVLTLDGATVDNPVPWCLDENCSGAFEYTRLTSLIPCEK